MPHVIRHVALINRYICTSERLKRISLDIEILGDRLHVSRLAAGPKIEVCTPSRGPHDTMRPFKSVFLAK